MKKLIGVIIALALFSCHKKDTIIKDAELVGTWRMDSVMYLIANSAFYIDTIYWGDAPNKRLLMHIYNDNTFSFEHISKESVGKGSFAITPYKTIKASAYPTNYPLTIYLAVYYFLEALNNATSYSIKDNQLSIFYGLSIAKFTKE